MSRPQHVFRVGSVVTGLRILAQTTRKTDPFWIERTHPSERIAYRVMCVECGFESVISYRAMRHRVRTGRTVCRSCAGRAAARRKDERITDPALAVALGAWR